MTHTTADHIYSEDIDYAKTTNNSIWGEEDHDTLLALEKLKAAGKLSGNWLHFAAGDGRYNNLLLREATQVLATDIDRGALEKLQRITPSELTNKLETRTQNIVEPFPFEDATFDGAFNTGTLHLFPDSVLETVLSEVNRVLQSKGIFVFDFATDISRTETDGTVLKKPRIQYTLASAQELLTLLLTKNNFKYTMTPAQVAPTTVTDSDGTYLFSCNYWIIVAEKMPK